MKVYNNIDDFKPISNAIVTIGTFDGVHFGHQKIIERLKLLAAQVDGQVVLLTFFPHPRMVIFPDDHGLQLLNTLSEKKQLLAQSGVNHLIIHPFSKSFSRLTSTQFIKDILVEKLKTHTLVIGYDHHFGRNREGSFDNLIELAPLYNFKVEQIPEQDVHDMAVSSTKIRNALLSGDLQTATDFLGYNFTLTGTVVHGKKLGRTLGFPTANLAINENYKLIPANGVYAVTVTINTNNTQKFAGALSIGNRPTFDNGPRSIEVYLINFTGDLYGQELTLSFKHYLRGDIAFSTTEALVSQINEDVKQVTKLLL
ncbi:MAG: bifunctional riboflavin kinase/FAD synthetase [Bacteroidia bacterium]|nr:bifunctional riboflavin kinase/FAD synthetase [Bacteroidia bacterium]